MSIREHLGCQADWMIKIAKGAALMTGTEMNYDLLAATYEVLPNNALSKMGYEVLQRVGPPQFSEEDQQWGAEVVKSLGKKLN